MRERQRFEREIEFLRETERDYDSSDVQRQEQCRRKWLTFRGDLPQPVKNALDNLDFEAAVAAAVRRGLRDAGDLTNMLFYTKYGQLHGYCAIKRGTRVSGGEPYDQAWQQIQAAFVTPKIGTPTLVIDLEKIKIDYQPETRLRHKSDGTYEGWFTKPVHLAQEPPSLREVKLSGRLKIADAIARRNYDAKKDGKKWSLGRAWIKALARKTSADGPTSSTAGVLRVKADGTFTTSTSVAFDGNVQRFAMQVTLELSRSTEIETTVELKLVVMDVARFLTFVEPYEKKRLASQTHLEFLASVRKIYQGGPNDPLEGAFNTLLFRHRNVKVLFAPDSAEAKWLAQNVVLYADGELADVGHVLTGIEGSPKQKPNIAADGQPQNVPAPPAVRDTLVTWAGDLGSVFQFHMPEIIQTLDQGKQPDLKKYIEKRASRADLIGDIDGINLGSIYDPTRSLTENFNAYYGKKSSRRFHEFVANSLDDNKNKALPLEPDSLPPKFAAKAREWIAFSVSRYVKLLNNVGVLDRNVAPAKKPLVNKIIQQDSPQMKIVADYFVAFLEEGLARETN